MKLDTIHERVADAMRAREGELIELHRTLVRIATVNTGAPSSGGETRAAEAGRSYLRRAGVAAEIAEGAAGRGNLLAETGAEAGPSILLMSHSDVVPVGDETVWTYPPFSGELAEGRIWGRGANDCKMLAAAHLFVMAVLGAEGLPGRGRLRLGMAADEEAGGGFGFGWLARERTDFLHCDIGLCEGGGASLGRFGEDAIFTIGTGEKGRYEVRVQFRGAGGHASTPWGHGNPLLRMAEFLRRVERTVAAVRPASPVFEPIAGWLGMDAITTENVEEAIVRVSEKSPALGRSLRAQSRTSWAPTVVRGGEKSNSLPDEATLTLDVRLLPGDAAETVNRLAAQWVEGLDDVRVEITETSAASSSELSGALRERFESAVGRATGRPLRGVPVWCSGFTDARLVRAVGTPVYGFQFVHPGADRERLGIHCVDESIEVGMLLPCALAVAHFVIDWTENT